MTRRVMRSRHNSHKFPENGLLTDRPNWENKLDFRKHEKNKIMRAVELARNLKDAKAVPALFNLLKDTESDLSREEDDKVNQAIIAIGESAIPFLMSKIKEEKIDLYGILAAKFVIIINREHNLEDDNAEIAYNLLIDILRTEPYESEILNYVIETFYNCLDIRAIEPLKDRLKKDRDLWEIIKPVLIKLGVPEEEASSLVDSLFSY